MLFAAALFIVYLRLSQTMPENSDQANVLLEASDMLHGNVLLHGWYKADVSFYTTELPQYALLEIIFGVHAQHRSHRGGDDLHAGRAAGRAGGPGRAHQPGGRVIRTAIAAGIMLAPQLGIGVSALLLSVGHIGTSGPRPAHPALPRPRPAALVCSAADRVGPGVGPHRRPLVLVVGVIPLALVCALRVIEAAVRERSLSAWPRARRYELSLIAAAGVAAGLAWVVERVLRALGGYILSPIPFKLTLHDLPANLHSCGPCRRSSGRTTGGCAGGPYYIALLHMVSLALVAAGAGPGGLAVLPGAALVDQAPGGGHRGQHRAVRGDQRGR